MRVVGSDRATVCGLRGVINEGESVEQLRPPRRGAALAGLVFSAAGDWCELVS